MNEGKKDRRDPIRTIKPRNFVAKNAGATTSGAGAHKDKKKAMKQGDVKHKKAEYAESLQHMLETALRDKEDLQAKRKALQDIQMDPDTHKDPELKAELAYRKAALEKEAKAKGLAEAEGDEEGLPELTVELAKHIRDQIGTEGPHAICKSVEWGDGAADDLVLLIQNALDEFIAGDTNEGYRDYDDNRSGFRRREREDDEYHVPDPEVAKEATRTYAPPKTDLKVGDRVVADLRKEKNYPTDQKYVSGFVTRIGEKGVHIDPDGGGEPEWHPYKIVKKLGESWTHDTLAAQLFETENTYEQQLAGKLSRALKK